MTEIERSARHARTVAEGWVPQRHGNPSSYNRGCRCDVCTAAHRDRIREGGGVVRHYHRNLDKRVIREGRWYAPDRPHGLRDTYCRFGCRCEPCRDANAAYERARREAGAA